MADWGRIKTKGRVQDRRGVPEVITEKRTAIGQALPMLGRPIQKKPRIAVRIGGETVGRLGRK